MSVPNRVPCPTRRATLRTVFLALCLVVPALIVVPRVHANGNIFIDPVSVPLGNQGDTFTVAVSAQNMDPFNGWDITVQTDPSIVSPVSISTAQSVVPGLFPLVNCVNGIGPGCTLSDGPGLAHSAAGASGVQSYSGRLFSITYQVKNGTATYAPITILKWSIVNGTPNPVTVTATEGAYGGQTPQPDFSITTGDSSVTVTRGDSLNVTFILSGNGNGFADTVHLTATSSQAGLGSLTWNNTDVFVADGSPPVASVLTINTTNTTPQTGYTVTLTGAPTSSRSHTFYLTLIVEPPGDFLLSATSYLLKVHAGLSGNSTIIVTSERGFADTIRLGVQSDTVGVAVSFNTTTLVLNADSKASALLTVNTPPSSLAFRYTLTVNATAVHHQVSYQSILIFVTPPTADIGFAVSSLHLTIRPGESSTLNVQLTSNDYFKGFSYLVATSISGVKLSFSESTFPLSYANETFGSGNANVNWVTDASSNLTITTDPSIPTGDHSLIVTVISGTLSRSITVTITVPRPAGSGNASTSGVSSPKLILGLQPLTYFGIIAALAAALGIAAFRELRRPDQKQRRVFLEDVSGGTSA